MKSHVENYHRLDNRQPAGKSAIVRVGDVTGKPWTTVTSSACISDRISLTPARREVRLALGSVTSIGSHGMRFIP